MGAAWTARWLTLLLCAAAPVHGQSSAAGAARVSWSLVDLVLVPDSAYGIWVLTSPNPGTTHWAKGIPVVSFSVEPVTLLQWAGAVQRLSRDTNGAAPAADGVPFRVTPRLQSSRGGRYIVVARNMAPKVHGDERLQLLVVDSASGTHWKTFATSGELDRLAYTIEEVVARAPSLTEEPDSTIATDEEGPGFTPVVLVQVPKPSYPLAMRQQRESGRVWAEYVVGPNGRVERGSIRILLADHQDFAKAAVDALERATFRPAVREGSPTRQRVFQTISFRTRS